MQFVLPKIYHALSPTRGAGLVQIANALTELLKDSAFWTVYRHPGTFDGRPRVNGSERPNCRMADYPTKT